MNICFVCYRGNMHCGGQGIYLYYLSRELARMGHNIDVIVGPPYPAQMDWAAVHPVENLNLWGRRKSFALSSRPLRIFTPLNFYELAVTAPGVFPEMLSFSVRAFMKLKELMRNRNFHIIHDVQSLGYGLLLLKRLGLPVISTVHHPLSIDRRIDLGIKRSFMEKFYVLTFYPPFMHGIVARRLDALLTACEEGKRAIVSELGVNPNKIKIVGNGIDLDLFKPLPGARRSEIDVLFVGNAEDTKKGIRYLLEALRLLDDHIKLTVVDEGIPSKTIAHSMVRKLGLEKRVVFTGKVSDQELVRLYCSAKVVALPSLFEGFGLPAAEAMACGAPVVATSAGALPEVVEDGVSGLIVPPASSGALAHAIEKVIFDDGLGLALSEAGEKRAAELFGWRGAAEKTLQAYRQIIGEFSEKIQDVTMRE